MPVREAKGAWGSAMAQAYHVTQPPLSVGGTVEREICPNYHRALMESFSSFDGSDIAYLDTGHGPAVLLLHGFAADHRVNWVQPGVVDALVADDRRVIAPDARGHGKSAKPHDPASYAGDAMVHDVQALLDHLHLDSVDVVGYSMGSLVSARLVPFEPRAHSLLLGGVGARLGGERRPMNSSTIADALETDDPSAVEDPAARAFRRFADLTGADRLALAALQRAPLGERAELDKIGVPTLVLTGDQDLLVGPPDALAAKIPGATYKVISGDHLTAVNDPAFAGSIVEFIRRCHSA
jgi:pimeloyl-ACP methyl ester carboxylesterase